MKLSVIIPCYNEAETIEATLEAVYGAALPLSWTREVIAVDDGSTDGTADILRKRAGEIITFFHTENRGKGAAVKTGLAKASGDYIVIQDADLEYDPNDFKALLQPIIDGRADAVLGSRNLGTNNVPVSRIFYYGGLLTTVLFNLLFFKRLSDIASCYKVFPRSYAPLLIASDHDDFVFDAVTLTRTILAHGSTTEVPISYRARTTHAGKKLNWLHGIKIVATIGLARLGLGSRRYLDLLGQLTRFGLTGGSALIINVALLYLLTEYAGIWYLASSIISFLCAFAFNFTVSKYWVFKSGDAAKIKKQLPLQLGVNVINLGINTILLHSFVEYIGLWYVSAQIIASILIACESFFVYRWIFK